jgi:hypothetical protein
MARFTREPYMVNTTGAVVDNSVKMVLAPQIFNRIQAAWGDLQMCFGKYILIK